MLSLAQISRIAIAVVLATPALLHGQSDGVVVLQEGDFERAPMAAAVSGDQRSALPATSLPADGEVHHFDPKRNAKADIQHALAVAARQKKHVLLEVGGEWCPFCKVLDRFFAEHATILALRQRNFVYVKVNFSEENRNDEALLDYPLIRGFPHFYVLNEKGKLIISQRVALLGTQQGYSEERFNAFLRKFSPARR